MEYSSNLAEIFMFSRVSNWMMNHPNHIPVIFSDSRTDSPPIRQNSRTVKLDVLSLNVQKQLFFVKLKSHTFFQTLIGALALFPTSQASPPALPNARSFNLAARDLSGLSCLTLVVGNCPGTGCTALGQVCVNIAGGNIVVTYPTLTRGSTYGGIHAYVALTVPANRAPG